MQPEQFKQVIEALTASQELIEKNSFDSINQHDKVANLFSELAVDFNIITMKIEAMNEQIEKIIVSKRNSDIDNQEIDKITQMFGEQRSMLTEVSKRLHTIMEEQLIQSDTIHEMEMQVADHREIMNETCYILKSDTFDKN